MKSLYDGEEAGAGFRPQFARRADGSLDLDAPVVRVCAAEVPVPYPKHLETAALPQMADIIAAVKNLPGIAK